MISLFQHLLAEKFDTLPSSIQAVHLPYTERVWQGRAKVKRGKSWLSRLCGWAARLPPALEDTEAQVTISQAVNGETWARLFGQHAMPSQLKQHGAYLSESLGLMRFLFRLEVENNVIHWRVHQVRFLILPLPILLFRNVHAKEYEKNRKYCFDVNVQLPFVGLLVHYHGWLLSE